MFPSRSRKAAEHPRPPGMLASGVTQELSTLTTQADCDSSQHQQLVDPWIWRAQPPPRPRLDLSYLEAIPPTGVTPRQLARARLRQACTSSTDPDSPPSPRCTNRTIPPSYR